LSKIDAIIDILRDGKLHRIEEIKSEITVDDFEMQKILVFLHKFDFVEVIDEKVRTKQSFRRLNDQKIT
jgi:hypothetical protein